MASSIVFGFQPDISDDNRHQLLEEILGLAGISAVEPLLPETVNTELARHWVAYVDEECDPASVVGPVREIPGIDYAALPSERGPIA